MLCKLHVQAPELFSKASPAGKMSRLLHFPLLRIVLVAPFILFVLAINGLFVFQVIEQLDEPLATNLDMLRMLVTIPLLIVSYRLYCRWVEKRAALEVSGPGAAKEWLAGVIFATSLVVLFVAIISVFGSFEILEYRSLKILLRNALTFSMGSLLQDIVLLCVLFRLLEEYAGTWIALLVSLLIFAFVHIANPNQTWVSAVFLVFSSIIIIAPFILTRRLWLSWGIHAGWNFMQAGVFGMANSGILFPGWMVSQVEGPAWLTGGAIGLEGSYLVMATDFVLGLLVLFLAIKAGQIIQPSWQRRARGTVL